MSYPRVCRLQECEATRSSPRVGWKDPDGVGIANCARRFDAEFCTGRHRVRHNDRRRRSDEELGHLIHTAAPEISDEVVLQRVSSPSVVSRRRRRTATTPEPLQRAALWLRNHELGPRSLAASSLRPRRTSP